MTSGAHSPAHDIRKLVVGLIDDQHLVPTMAQRYRFTAGAPRADVFDEIADSFGVGRTRDKMAPLSQWQMRRSAQSGSVA
jgi:hypothetical protein